MTRGKASSSICNVWHVCSVCISRLRRLAIGSAGLLVSVRFILELRPVLTYIILFLSV